MMVATAAFLVESMVALFVESMLEMKAESLADQKAAMMVVDMIESMDLSIDELA